MNKIIELPIDNFKSEIIKTVEENPVTIIVAETGAGKSLRVPMMLVEDLDYSVVVTQPRRIAAESLAIRAAEERGYTLGRTIGFRTAQNFEDSVVTKCLYCTDGLQLIKELKNARISSQNGFILIIDEVHEFNENIETLIAWSKQLLDNGESIKVVIMSATLEAEALSEYFKDAPIIKVPGRTFDVEGAPIENNGPRQVRETQMVQEIKKNVTSGDNTLVFLPGKAEITLRKQQLEDESINAEVIILHGELSSEEQKLAFQRYARPKIILSTNLAQTSITIPDITAVVDSGLEKRIHLEFGIETLVLGPISKADVKQRAGRAGRVAKGKYVLCSDTPYHKFDAFSKPQIESRNLDQLVLRLADVGFDAVDLDFFHQPNVKTLQSAKTLLVDMKALTSDGEVTRLGKEINRFPTSTIVGRIIIESIERGCLSTILDMAAILANSRSSIKLQNNKSREYPPHYRFWNEVIPSEKKYSSDLFIELDLWQLGYDNYRALGEHGVDEKFYKESIKIRKRLKDVIYGLGYENIGQYNSNASNEDEILKCVLSGMIHGVYAHIENEWYKGPDSRKISHHSRLKQGDLPDIIIGIPKNISIKTKGEPITIAILEQCSVIPVEWLHEVAPHLFWMQEEEVSWNYMETSLTSDLVAYFKDYEILRQSRAPEWNESNLCLFTDTLATVHLPDDESKSEWIVKLRLDFFHKEKGDNIAFGNKFREAICKYKTFDLSKLEIFKNDIRSRVLG